MDSLKDVLNGRYGKSKYRLEADYQKNYDEDMTFRKIANDLDLPKDKLMKYTTKLERSACELKNCINCKNIYECRNEIDGYVYYPQKNEMDIEFCYMPFCIY